MWDQSFGRTVAGDEDNIRDYARQSSSSTNFHALHLSVTVTGIALIFLFFFFFFRTPEFCDWAFMKARGEPIQEIWNKIPDGIDILVTHGPPLGRNDETLIIS